MVDVERDEDVELLDAEDVWLDEEDWLDDERLSAAAPVGSAAAKLSRNISDSFVIHAMLQQVARVI